MLSLVTFIPIKYMHGMTAIKSFVITSLRFGLPVLIAVAGIGFLADGYTDHYYLKFTTPPQNALIVGISRAEAGLRPDVLNPALRETYPGHSLYNFAFNLRVSPFGKVYLDAIKNKLDENSRAGIFIVAVDPWSVAAEEPGPNNADRFAENNECLGKLTWMNTYPNFPYLFNCYNEPYITILTKRIKEQVSEQHAPRYLHNDGWLEITVPMDSLSVARRTNTTLATYEKQFLHTYTPSATRRQYLGETIRFLKQHGDVYLVQLPVHPALAAINHLFYPAFNQFMDSIARQHQAPHFNLTGSAAAYTFIDGSHLCKESAAAVSAELARLIIQYKHSR